jgi:phospholipid/cholesterol/gamma-HCH transport system substrate-binding protein
VLISAAFTVLLAVKIGNLALGSHRYSISAQFRDASGVFVGDAVKLAGVDVGRVSGTKIDKGLGIVTFDLNDDVKLTSDSIVAIRWRNVLGQRFIYVYPGRAGKPLQDGAVIPVSQTEEAGDLGQFLNELGPILKAIDPDKANAFLDSVNTALAGNAVAVRQLLDDGATLAGRLGSMDSQIQTLIGSSDTVMSTYARQDHAIGLILDHLNILGGQLRGMTGDLDSLIVNFADVQKQLDQLLKRNHGNIDATLSELNMVLATLGRNAGNLETTLCTLPAGLSPYFQTTSWGEWFNVRVVEFTLKDRSGNILFSGKENSQNRSNEPVSPAYTSCAGGGSTTGPGGPGGGGPKHSPSPTPSPCVTLPIPTPSLPLPTLSLPTPTPCIPKPGEGANAGARPPPGFGNLGDLIDTVLAGSKGGRGG